MNFLKKRLSLLRESRKIYLFDILVGDGTQAGVPIHGVLAGQDPAGGNIQVLADDDRTVIGQLGHLLGVQITVGKTTILFQCGHGDPALMADGPDKFDTVEHTVPPFLD